MKSNKLLVTISFVLLTLFLMYPVTGNDVAAVSNPATTTEVYSAYKSIIKEKARDIFYVEAFTNCSRERRKATALYDIDGDGIEELFFLYNDSGNADGSGILSIYSYKDGRAVKMIEDFGLGTPGQSSNWTLLAGNDSDFYIFDESAFSETAMHLTVSSSRSVICSEIYKKDDMGYDYYVYSQRTTPVEINNIWEISSDGFRDDLTESTYNSAVANMKNAAVTVLLTAYEEYNLPSVDLSFMSLLKKLNFHDKGYYPSSETINEVFTRLGYDKDGKSFMLISNGRVSVDVYCDTNFVKYINFGTQVLEDDQDAYFGYEGSYSSYTFTYAKGKNALRISFNSGFEGLMADLLTNLLEPIEDESGYNIIISESEHGSVAVEKTKCEADTLVNVSVTPHYGYTIDKLMYSTEGGGSIDITSDKCFSMPDCDVSIIATYKKTVFRVGIEYSDHGSVSVAKNYLIKGSQVKVTVTPETEYVLDELKYVLSDGTTYDITSTKQFTMPASDVTISATFKLKEYPININSSMHGSISTEKTTYPKGSTVYVSVDPEEGYELTKLSYTHSNGSTVDITLNKRFSMPSGAVTLKATFSLIKYDVSLLCGNNGTAMISAEQATKGQTIYVTVSPNEDYMIDAITYTTGTGIVTDITGNRSFVMPASDVEVDVSFKPMEYPVVLSNSSYGTISTPQTAYCEGATVYVSVAPKSGYALNKLSYVVGNNSPKDITLEKQFSMPKSQVTITAEYVRVYQVSCLFSYNGSVKTDKRSYKKDDVVLVDVIPNEGYELDKLTYSVSGGNPVDITSSQEFVMPDKNVQISATFKAVSYNITLSFNDDLGSASISTTSATIGQNIVVNVTPNDGCSFVISYTPEGDAPYGITGSNSFKMPAKNVQVDVIFYDKLYMINVFNMQHSDENRCSIKLPEGIPGLYHEWQHERNKLVTLEVTLADGVQADKLMVFQGFGEAFGYKPSELTPLFDVPFNEWTKEDEGLYLVQFVMPDCDISVSLAFIYDNVNISLNTGEHGSVVLKDETNVLTEEYVIPAYDYLTVDVTPDEGYEVDKAVYTFGDNVYKNLPKSFYYYSGEVVYRIIAKKDMSIEVSFKPQDYSVAVNKPTNGKISVGEKTYAYGSTVEIITTPDIGYELDKLTYSVNGENPIDISSTKQFVMPAGNVVISATFKPIYYDISIAENDYIELSVSASQAKKGETVNIFFDPTVYSKLNRLVYTTEDGVDHDILFSSTVSFSMPASDVVIKALLRKPTVYFYAGKDVYIESVAFGDVVQQPSVTNNSYDGVFDGWYTDYTYSEKYDFSTPVTRDMYIYGKYRSLNITFDYDDFFGWVNYSYEGDGLLPGTVVVKRFCNSAT